MSGKPTYEELKKRVQELEKTDLQFKRSQQIMQEVIDTLFSIFKAIDPYISKHQRWVAELAIAIAECMKLSDDKKTGVRMAGIIHNIGKIVVPSEVLTKQDRLSETEFEFIKSHPHSGYDILKGISFDLPIAEIVYQHHERMDGSGYPRGLSGNDILLEARIIAVADVVEAMSSDRPYRPALGMDAALEEIVKNKRILFDADAVDACTKVIRENGFRFED